MSAVIARGALGVLALALIWSQAALSVPAGSKAALHSLTEGFGRGRVDRPGIVAEGGGVLRLPPEGVTIEILVSGAGIATVGGVATRSHQIALRETPQPIERTLPSGGSLLFQGERVRIHELRLRRDAVSPVRLGLAFLLAIATLVISRRPSRQSLFAAFAILIAGGTAISIGSLGSAFLRLLAGNLEPWVITLAAVAPLVVALFALGPRVRDVPRPHALTTLAFATGLGAAALQLSLYPQPLILGDPQAYWDMGGEFKDAARDMSGPLTLGFTLDRLRPYLALLAPGLLYGGLRAIADDARFVYGVQALFIGITVAGMASIARRTIGRPAALFVTALGAAHPTFAILPGLLQPEPFILAAWVLSLRLLVTASAPGDFLAPGLLFAAGLALHPQGLGFLLVALLICLAPWARELWTRRAHALAFVLGLATVFLPVRVAEHLAKPATAILNERFGFFAYTSPYPLGFWLFLDSSGWQGTRRMEESEYVRSFRAEDAAEPFRHRPFGPWPYTVGYVLSRPESSAETVLTNLHRLWHEADNPFFRRWIGERESQNLVHRSLVVLFVLAWPFLLTRRDGLQFVVVPLAILSMTYPAYHVFNKYATPALPFLVLGAVAFVAELSTARPERRLVGVALLVAAAGALAPVEFVASILPGETAVRVLRVTTWTSLVAALWFVNRSARGNPARWRETVTSVTAGLVVLVLASVAAARSDTSRGEWTSALSHFEVVCSIPQPLASPSNDDESWLFVDLKIVSGHAPPRVTLDGRDLGALTPTMPDFPLAAYRGQRDPRTFRQLWRVQIPTEVASKGERRFRFVGAPGDVIFGDVRSTGNGPWLSLGDWPHLSVYRLMHEGQYRLPVFERRGSACATADGSRPGTALISLARMRRGDEMTFSRSPGVTIRRLF